MGAELAEFHGHVWTCRALHTRWDSGRGLPLPRPGLGGAVAPSPRGSCAHGVSLLMQQWRLLPYLAAVYALDHFAKSLFLNLVEFQQGLLGGDRSARQVSAACFSPRCCYVNRPFFQNIPAPGVAGHGLCPCSVAVRTLWELSEPHPSAARHVPHPCSPRAC